jgi:GMP synthase-like glutamine amidotransferase
VIRVGLLQVGHIEGRSLSIGGDYLELFTKILQPHGIGLHRFACDEGELPESVDDFDGWLCTPSRRSTYDDLAWLPDVSDLLRTLVAEERPLVGICFGHQLLAHALGGEVKRADGGWNVGVQDYAVLEHPWWMEPARDHVRLIASHQDQVVTLPPAATLLAGNDACPNGGMLVGERAWTLQTHPEFTPALADSLLAARVELLGADVVASARASLAEPADQDLVAWWLPRSRPYLLWSAAAPRARLRVTTRWFPTQGWRVPRSHQPTTSPRTCRRSPTRGGRARCPASMACRSP